MDWVYSVPSWEQYVYMWKSKLWGLGRIRDLYPLMDHSRVYLEKARHETPVHCSSCQMTFKLPRASCLRSSRGPLASRNQRKQTLEANKYDVIQCIITELTLNWCVMTVSSSDRQIIWSSDRQIVRSSDRQILNWRNYFGHNSQNTWPNGTFSISLQSSQWDLSNKYLWLSWTSANQKL